MFGHDHEYRTARYVQRPLFTHQKQVAPSTSRKTTRTTIPSSNMTRQNMTSVLSPPTPPRKSTYLPPMDRKTRANMKREQENYNRLYGNPATTMTGLPWEVRHNPTGMVRFPEKKILPPPRPRMGTYTYTYGVDSENDRQSGQSGTVQHPTTSKQTSSKPQAHSREDDFPETVKKFLDQSKNKLTISGYSASLAELMRQTGNPPITPTTPVESESVRRLKNLEGLWDDIRDDSASTVKESDSLSPSEIAEATNAFDWPAAISQHPESVKFHVNHPMHKGHGRGEKKINKIPEPQPEVFQQSYRLLPHLQQKLIEEQVIKEFASKNVVPTAVDYIKRKEELMKAAFKAGYSNEKSSATIFPDLVQEYNYKDLFKSHDEDDQDFDVIPRPRPAYTISQQNPKRHIQTLSPPMLDPKDVKLRQRRKESIMGTVLREIANKSQDPMAPDAAEPEESELPPRKRTKDQEKNRQLALRAMEAYRLIQERQKAVIHRVPQVTVRRHGPQLGDKIPPGSEYHQMALGHTHRSHPPQPKLIAIEQKTKYKTQQPKPTGTDKWKSRAKTPARQTQQYPTHMGSQGLPGPPPPISETVFPSNHKSQPSGKKGTKIKNERDDSGYRPDDYDDD